MTVPLINIAHLASRYGANPGSSEMRASHVLLLDRLNGLAYFAERRRGEEFLAQQRILLHQGH